MGIKEDGRQTFYDVRCEGQAADAIEAMALAFPRGGEVYDALELLLSRMPYVGSRLAGRNPPEFVIRSGFHNSRASRPATRKRQAA